MMIKCAIYMYTATYLFIQQRNKCHKHNNQVIFLPQTANAQQIGEHICVCYIIRK